jgi:S1-C subfamily serine protease
MAAGASSGVGFAIPIDQARGLVEQILTYGKVVRPVLGAAPPAPGAPAARAGTRRAGPAELLVR